MLTIIVIVASFIGVAALVGGVAMLFRGDGATQIEERLDVFAGKSTAAGGRAARRGRLQPAFVAIG